MDEMTWEDQRRWSYAILITLIAVAFFAGAGLAFVTLPFYAVLAGFAVSAIVWVTGLVRWPATWIYNKLPKKANES